MAAAGSITVTLSSPEPEEANQTLEDGELVEKEDSVQILDR
jgi:hypothetical protein